MRTVEEVKNELIGLGFVDYNDSRDSKFSFIYTEDNALVFLKDYMGFWTLSFKGSVFRYSDYGRGWVKIEEALSLEAMILLYGNM